MENTYLYAVLFIIYYLGSIYLLILDWRKSFDLKAIDLIMFAVIFWIVGPFVYLLGRAEGKVVLKKKEDK